MSPEDLLSRSLMRARRAQAGHFDTAERLERFKIFLGLPIVVLSTIVGSSIFAMLENDTDPKLKFVAACLSITSAILASIQIFVSFPERAEKHKAAATKYGELKRKIEQLQGFPTQDLAAEAKLLGETADKLSEESPVIPKRIWDRVDKRLRAERHSPLNK